MGPLLSLTYIHICRIEFPKRTYILYANSDDECEHWVELLRSKILVCCINFNHDLAINEY